MLDINKFIGKNYNVDITNDEDKVIINLTDDLEYVCCPKCHNLEKVYDRKFRVWRHLDYKGTKVYIQYSVPRVRCDIDGVKQSEISWAGPRQKFTKEMQSFIYDLSKYYSNVEIAKMLDIHDTQVRRIILKIKEKNEKGN